MRIGGSARSCGWAGVVALTNHFFDRFCFIQIFALPTNQHSPLTLIQQATKTAIEKRCKILEFRASAHLLTGSCISTPPGTKEGSLLRR